jgi:hypothetical protein
LNVRNAFRLQEIPDLTGQARQVRVVGRASHRELERGETLENCGKRQPHQEQGGDELDEGQAVLAVTVAPS